MDSDNDSYHSENEFYYCDEENVLQENKNIVNTSNDTSADEEMSTIQDFFEGQKPKNTTKKTACGINAWKKFCSSIGEVRELENFSWQPQRTLVQIFHGREEKGWRRLRASFPVLIPKKHSKVLEGQKFVF